MDKNSRYEIHGMFNKNVTIEDLCFPNNLLEFYLYFYENLNTNRHLPQKIIKRNKEMKKLYEKIKAVKENEEAWIKAMEEADDIDFVKQNLEKKLGEDLTNKKLWILYIKYLKEYDIKELLQVYSKYCRFFVDDVGMKEEYQKAAKKYGKVAVAWNNAFSFEKSDEKVATQNFPFQSRLIDYIGETAKAQVLQKLNFSCKYFYNKYRIPVCNYLFILTSGPAWATFDIEEEALIFHSNTMKEVHFNNLYIMTRFHYHHNIPLCSLIPKLYKCDAKYIDISDEQLTMDEFKFFIGHGNVNDLRFCRLKITDGNGEQLFVEDILAFTPKLQYLMQVFSKYRFKMAKGLSRYLEM
uniref:Uncharacterized protein n=1 Tax=Panagrolaimus sp. ES5 TaxID=591445 RepID=A0AC34FLU3_9BILA